MARDQRRRRHSAHRIVLFKMTFVSVRVPLWICCKSNTKMGASNEINGRWERILKKKKKNWKAVVIMWWCRMFGTVVAVPRTNERIVETIVNRSRQNRMPCHAMTAAAAIEMKQTKLLTPTDSMQYSRKWYRRRVDGTESIHFVFNFLLSLFSL